MVYTIVIEVENLANEICSVWYFLFDRENYYYCNLCIFNIMREVIWSKFPFIINITNNIKYLIDFLFYKQSLTYSVAFYSTAYSNLS